MKKALLSALMGLAVLASCNKEATPTSTISLRTLNYQMSGSMYTKSATADDVVSLISSALPEHLPIVLTGQTNGRTITTATGEATNIPSDTYSVTGTFIGTQIGRNITANGASIQSEPAFHVQKSLIITDDETEYTLSASYDCFALVCDMTLVESVSFTNGWSEENTITPTVLNDTGIFYAYGDYDSNYLHITIVPKDTDVYRVTEYTICTSNRQDLQRAEKGKWYLVSPCMAGIQPKLVGYDLPTMTQGTF